jgi:hypothetical protein
MQILLSEQESAWWQAGRYKLRLTPAQKADILVIADAGETVDDISAKTGIEGRQVSGVIHGHKYPVQENLRNPHNRPVAEVVPSGVSISAEHAESPTTPIQEAQEKGTERAIRRAIKDMMKAKMSLVRIRGEINRVFSRNYTLDDITDMMEAA